MSTFSALTRKTILLTAALLLCGFSGARAQIRYQIVPQQSTFTYSMEHTMHSWDGTSKEASGWIDADSSFQQAAIEVVIPVLSFDSGNRNRDSHMAEAVESYIYPEVRFKSTQVSVDTSAVQGQEPGLTWRVCGDLEFHGATHSIECPVRLTPAGGQLHVHGAFSVKLTDFDIELPSLLGIKVKDQLNLVFDVEARVPATVSVAPTRDSAN